MPQVCITQDCMVIAIDILLSIEKDKFKNDCKWSRYPAQYTEYFTI